ncbi:MAG: hypothetical protein KDD29_00190 [Flavobacteriales bacterium]|nr:hypothetical protein [Flavobacteriales bacterium]MCB9335680.1 hypothetical protein [Flavobacteriales bacterium]
MKKMMIIAISMMCFHSFSMAQNKMEVSYSILKNGKETEHVKEVNASDMGMLFVNLLHVPDLSGYDMITAVVRFKGRNHSGGYIQFSADEFAAKLKSSKRTPGMKYLLLAVVNKIDNPDNGNGFFTIDEYPFEPFGYKYLFSKEGAGNIDNFQLEFELRGQKIIKYETVWENGKSVTKPVYGDFTSLSPKAEVTVNTDANVAAKPRSSKVGDPNDLKKMFGK